MIKINLLPDSRPVKKKKGVTALGGAGRLNMILLGAAIGVAALVILVQWWLLTSQIKDLDEKIRRDQLEVARLESVLREVKDFEGKKARLQKKVDLINQLRVNQKGPVRLMDEVSNALPDLVWLEKMEYKGSTIGLEGKALNPPAIGNFIENLRKVKAFQEPTLQDMTACSAGAANLYCFRLNFTFSALDRTQGEAPPAPAAPGPGAAPPSTAPPAKAEAPVPAQPARVAAVTGS